MRQPDLEIKRALLNQRPMQVKITAMSQRCRKFDTPHVRQYTGIQIASHKSAAQRSQGREFCFGCRRKGHSPLGVAGMVSNGLSETHPVAFCAQRWENLSKPCTRSQL